MSEKTELFCRLPSKPLNLEQWWTRAIWRPFIVLPIASAVGFLFIIVPGIVLGTASIVGLPLYAPIAYWLVRQAKKHSWTYEQRWKILNHLTWIMPLFAGIALTIVSAVMHKSPFSSQAWETVYPIGIFAFGIGLILTLIYLIYINQHTAKLRKQNLLAF